MPPSSNNKLILKIAFVVLFLALLGELGYILLPKNKNVGNVNAPLPTISSSPIKPSVTPTVVKSQGEITKLNIITTTPDAQNKKIEFSFMLKTTNMDKLQIFFFDESEIKYLKVIDPKGKEISYKDLKINQNITFIQTLGSKVNPSKMEIKILD